MSELLIDVGNTRMKWVRWDGGALAGSRVAGHRGRLDAALRTMAEDLTTEVDRITVANVAGPEVADALRRFADDNGVAALRFLASERQACGVVNAYDEPQKLGVDRWAAMIGAHRRTQSAMPGAASCIIGAGTAVTLDVVRATGEHLGGLIMASADLAMRMLVHGTSDIGAVDMHDTRWSMGLLGRNTSSAVTLGAWVSLGAGLDRSVSAVRESIASPCSVYLTGGGANTLRDWLETEVQMQKDLVFEGMLALIDARASS
jgi:type III pantothenate kinase